MTTRVILVRHGESTYNLQRRVQGHCDESSLTEKGQSGARQVGTALQGLRFDAIYTSPLQRAKQTAQLISDTLAESDEVPALQPNDLLKEINLLPWEGMTFQEVEQQFPEGYRLWQETPHLLKIQVPAADGSLEDFYPVPALYEQARQFWQEILPHHAGETIVVVAHSGINRSLIGTAIGLSEQHYITLHQANCGISILNFSGGLGEPVQMESLNLTAHLGEKLPKPRSGAQAPWVRLLLVRHGETDWNREKRFQGQIDVPLNEQGRQQSRQAAQFLQDVTIDRAVSSPMLRPKETAEIILQHHPNVTLELDSALCEISHGLWEGKLEAEIREEYDTELQQWQVAPETVQMPEGENLQQVWDRVNPAWDAIVSSTPAQDGRPTTVLVVAHDAVNKAILCHLVGFAPDHFWTFKQGNGAISVIDYSPQKPPIVQAVNITTHFGGVIDRTAAGAL